MTNSSPLSAPASMASKRRSWVVSTGPRPLHLVHGNVPSTAPLASTFDLKSPPPPSSLKSADASSKQARRQSSICYRSSDLDASVRPSPRSRHSLTPNFTLGSPKFGDSPVASPSPRNRGSRVFETNGTQERPPLTLAEKHSDLLHSIAHKESQCLELRSQLAVHEADLLQLKRKWERIVNLGLEKAVDGQPHAAQGSGAVLDGIKEGVHGVSRLIAAGLAIGDPPASSSSSPPSRSRPRPAIIAVPTRPTHSTTQSNSSSVSTFTSTTKSTRFSQSSASSLGSDMFIDVDPSPAHTGKEKTKKEMTEGDLSSSSDENVLMVHDTGATPTMSPNPAFVQRQMRREERQMKRASLALQQSTSTSTTSVNTRASLDGLDGEVRRRSLNYARSPFFGEEDEDVSRMVLSPAEDKGFPPISLVEGVASREKDKIKAKRASAMMNAGFPPVSSIPGLGSLALSGGSAAGAQPISSWVGSVGRKWEELQKGTSTFAKKQKRASMLISDVFSALAPPPPGPPPSSYPSPSAFSSNSASSRSELKTPSSPYPLPSYFSPLNAASAMTASITGSSSLLDADDGDHGVLAESSEVMKPSLPPSLKRQPTMAAPVSLPQHARENGAGGRCGAGNAGQKPPKPTMKVMQPMSSASKPKQQEREQEEEWNWAYFWFGR